MNKHSVVYRGVVVCGALCVMLAAHLSLANKTGKAPAAAPATKETVAAAPAGVTVQKGKVYDDWGTLCEKQAKSTLCYITQSQMNKDDGKQMLKISVGYLGPKGEPMVVAMLPLGISIPSGAAFKVDENAQNPLVIQSCTLDGCAANTVLSKEVLQQMMDGKSAIVGVVPANQTQTLGIRVSLKGFKDGFKALPSR